MSLADWFQTYQEEIELIQAQNRVECDLYSLIAHIVRAGEQGKKISLRDVSTRRTSKLSKWFKGSSGFPDFVIMKREKCETPTIFGAIEAKRIGLNLDAEESLEQLNGHCRSYKRVIYTNGLIWRLYKLDERDDIKMRWEIVLGEFDKRYRDIITWKDTEWKHLLEELDAINWDQQK